jgi:hypothetical protein
MPFVHDCGGQVCHQKPLSGFHEGLRSVAGSHRWLRIHQVVCTTTTTCQDEARQHGWLHAHMHISIS